MTLKQERMSRRILQILSELFMFEVTDPRLVDITVTEVRVDREIMYADIFVNALGEEERREEILEGLDSARGFLRRQLATRTRLRRVPELRFHWDDNLAHAEHMNEILDNLEYATDNDLESDDEDLE
jgi:ribosome-binding factor A